MGKKVSALVFIFLMILSTIPVNSQTQGENCILPITYIIRDLEPFAERVLLKASEVTKERLEVIISKTEQSFYGNLPKTFPQERIALLLSIILQKTDKSIFKNLDNNYREKLSNMLSILEEKNLLKEINEYRNYLENEKKKKSTFFYLKNLLKTIDFYSKNENFVLLNENLRVIKEEIELDEFKEETEEDLPGRGKVTEIKSFFDIEIENGKKLIELMNEFKKENLPEEKYVDLETELYDYVVKHKYGAYKLFVFENELKNSDYDLYEFSVSRDSLKKINDISYELGTEAINAQQKELINFARNNNLPVSTLQKTGFLAVPTSSKISKEKIENLKSNLEKAINFALTEKAKKIYQEIPEEIKINTGSAEVKKEEPLILGRLKTKRSIEYEKNTGKTEQYDKNIEDWYNGLSLEEKIDANDIFQGYDTILLNDFEMLLKLKSKTDKTLEEKIEYENLLEKLARTDLQDSKFSAISFVKAYLSDKTTGIKEGDLVIETDGIGLGQKNKEDVEILTLDLLNEGIDEITFSEQLGKTIDGQIAEVNEEISKIYKKAVDDISQEKLNQNLEKYSEITEKVGFGKINNADELKNFLKYEFDNYARFRGGDESFFAIRKIVIDSNPKLEEEIMREIELCGISCGFLVRIGSKEVGLEETFKTAVAEADRAVQLSKKENNNLPVRIDKKGNIEKLSKYEEIELVEVIEKGNFYFEREWSPVAKDGVNPVEKIIVDYVDPELEKIINEEFEKTFGKLSENPSEKELENSAMYLSLALNGKLPFLGKDNINFFNPESGFLPEIPDETWRNYFDFLSEVSEKLSDLTKEKMLDCTGQNLNILFTKTKDGRTLYDRGWELYFDVLSTKDNKFKNKVHTMLVKKFETKEGEIAVIVDSTELFGTLGNTHGFIRDWSDFENNGKFANAKVELETIKYSDEIKITEEKEEKLIEELKEPYESEAEQIGNILNELGSEVSEAEFIIKDGKVTLVKGIFGKIRSLFTTGDKIVFKKDKTYSELLETNIEKFVLDKENSKAGQTFITSLEKLLLKEEAEKDGFDIYQGSIPTKIIGVGGYAEVYSIFIDNEEFVLKVEKKADAVMDAKREAKITKDAYPIGPKPIAYYYDNQGKFVGVIYEKIEGKTLSEENYEDESLEQREILLNKIFDALMGLWEKGIAHKDLYLGNIMIQPKKGKEYDIRIIDYGQSKRSTEKDFVWSLMWDYRTYKGLIDLFGKETSQEFKEKINEKTAEKLLEVADLDKILDALTRLQLGQTAPTMISMINSLEKKVIELSDAKEKGRVVEITEVLMTPKDFEKILFDRYSPSEKSVEILPEAFLKQFEVAGISKEDLRDMGYHDDIKAVFTGRKPSTNFASPGITTKSKLFDNRIKKMFKIFANFLREKISPSITKKAENAFKRNEEKLRKLNLIYLPIKGVNFIVNLPLVEEVILDNFDVFKKHTLFEKQKLSGNQEEIINIFKKGVLEGEADEFGLFMGFPREDVDYFDLEFMSHTVKGIVPKEIAKQAGVRPDYEIAWIGKPIAEGKASEITKERMREMAEGIALFNKAIPNYIRSSFVKENYINNLFTEKGEDVIIEMYKVYEHNPEIITELLKEHKVKEQLENTGYDFEVLEKLDFINGLKNLKIYKKNPELLEERYGAKKMITQLKESSDLIKNGIEFDKLEDKENAINEYSNALKVLEEINIVQKEYAETIVMNLECESANKELVKAKELILTNMVYYLLGQGITKNLKEEILMQFGENIDNVLESRESLNIKEEDGRLLIQGCLACTEDYLNPEEIPKSPAENLENAQEISKTIEKDRRRMFFMLPVVAGIGIVSDTETNIFVIPEKVNETINYITDIENPEEFENKLYEVLIEQEPEDSKQAEEIIDLIWNELENTETEHHITESKIMFVFSGMPLQEIEKEAITEKILQKFNEKIEEKQLVEEKEVIIESIKISEKINYFDEIQKQSNQGKIFGENGLLYDLRDGFLFEDKQTDKIIKCEPEEKRSCYPAEQKTRNTGLCKAGIQECSELGVWNICVNSVVPEEEICDGLDNDCNGMIDENLDMYCYTGSKETDGIGSCRAGIKTCSQGQWSDCEGEILPKEEICNRIDDNCNHLIDENCKKSMNPVKYINPEEKICTQEGESRSCYTGKPNTKGIGICKTGIQTCVNREWSDCMGEIIPEQEQCNGLDDNCDGRIDENLERICYDGLEESDGLGICNRGIQTCFNGKWNSCLGQKTSEKEICDGIDNNCDGKIDNNCIINWKKEEFYLGEKSYIPCDPEKTAESIACCWVTQNPSQNLESVDWGIGSLMMPEGFEIINKPYKMQCSGDWIDITSSISDNFKDVHVLRCREGNCEIISKVEIIPHEGLTCYGFDISASSEQNINLQNNIEKEKPELKQEKTLMQAGEIKLKENKFEFPFIDEATNVFLGIGEKEIKYPMNSNLLLAGSPMNFGIKEIMPKNELPVIIKMKFLESDSYNARSLSIYALTKEGWIKIESKRNDKEQILTSEIKNIYKYLDENNEGTFAIFGIKCDDCDIPTFKKYYEGTNNNALILIPGLGGKPETFNALIEEMKLTKQPMQTWVYGFPLTFDVDTAAKQLAKEIIINSEQFTKINFIGFSFGSLVLQEALKQVKEYDENIVKKIEKILLIAGPNQGSPVIKIYENFLSYLEKNKVKESLFLLTEEIKEDLLNGRIVERLEGPEYYVMAGDEPYNFNIGFFEFSTEELFDYESNDGIVSIKSAQNIGGEYIEDSCKNYFELPLTHTEMNDQPIAREVMGNIINKDSFDKNIVLLGQNQYARYQIKSCQSDDIYLLVGKALEDDEKQSVINCGCGNGVCAVDENPLICPEDCAEREKKFEVSILAKVALGILIILFLFSLFFMMKHKKKEDKKIDILFKKMTK